MSKYTTQIRWLVETNYDLGLKEYPIFDEDYREALNQKIIRHYYFREIGLETPGLFKWFLNQRMAEIMPYYNQLYKSELIKIEPLTRLDWQETLERTHDVAEDKNQTYNNQTDEGSTTNSTAEHGSTQNDSGYSQDATSDTPQNISLDVQTSFADLPASAASARDVTNSSKTTANDSQDTSYQAHKTDNATTSQDNTINTLEYYIKKYTGNNAGRTDSEMLNEFRTTFLNIDMMIIDNLADLFMSVY